MMALGIISIIVFRTILKYELIRSSVHHLSAAVADQNEIVIRNTDLSPRLPVLPSRIEFRRP